jgi:hypothetical protein
VQYLNPIDTMHFLITPLEKILPHAYYEFNYSFLLPPRMKTKHVITTSMVQDLNEEKKLLSLIVLCIDYPSIAM